MAARSARTAILVSDRGSLKAFAVRWKNPRLWKTGLFCGLALFAASSFQQIGLLHTEPGKAGFLTAMYIVMVPILGLFLKKIPPVSTVFSVILAVAGLYLLSCTGASGINIGDILLLFGALGFATQIVLIDRWGQGLDSLRLNCIQCLVCCVLSTPLMVMEKPVLSDVLNAWMPSAYAGVLSMGVSYSLQIVGQRHLDSTSASLIMSLESVIAVLSGWVVLHQMLTFSELCGCALVFCAVILSQIPFGKKISLPHPHAEKTEALSK